ncbi:MAG: penicillin-binding protein activator [Caulobacterales bacterium]
MSAQEASSSRKAAAPSVKARSLKALGAASLAAMLAACATQGGPGGPSPLGRPSSGGAPPSTSVTTRDGVTPPFMAGQQITRVGILLPFSTRPQEAAALYNAAELALFDHGDPSMLLIPRDAGADATAAQAAAQALLTDGADIIIGPVTREGVEGATRAASRQSVPVIGFSSDRAVAGNGAYLLSFQLEDEIDRIVSYAASRNIRTIAFLGPSNEYGRRVEAALRSEAARRGVTVTRSEFYTRSDSEAAAAAARLASGPAPQGILIAESGAVLRAASVALVRAGVSTRQTKLLGTSAWDSPDTEREPTLGGGWFVASDPGLRQNFEQRYRQAFNRDATRLSSLGYDAVALSALLARDGGANGFTRAGIQRSDGFLGSDGIFRFRADGSIERGLAVMEVRANGSTAADPAPRRFTAPAG